MITLYAALVIALASTLLIWTPPLWRARRLSGLTAIIAEIFLISVVVGISPGLGSSLFAAATAYAIFNYARVIRGRMQIDHLYKVTWRAGLVLTATQLLLMLSSLHIIDWPAAALFIAITCQLALGLLLLWSTSRSVRKTKTLQATMSYTDAALPSISVLIPARNETEDLQACLQALIASNYPKLEIIVLDDCSQSRHTSEVIRSFAHDGVRFLAGEAPGDNWLAKNFAYHQLAEAANGEYLVFCGADLQMSPNALRELITTLLEKQKTMLSVLPQNVKPSRFSTYLIQPARYAWELSLPRRILNRPAVLSTCWVIKHDVFQAAGGFKAVSRTILPESYLARFTARHDGYSFLRSNLLVSDKTAAHQRATAIRMRYPQLRKRPELVLAVSVAEIGGVTMALPAAVYVGVFYGWLLAVPAITAFITSYIVYLQLTGVMYGRSVIWGLFNAPFAALYDAYLLNISMYRYEFGEVNWKERNICLPVMRFDEQPAQVPQPNREP